MADGENDVSVDVNQSNATYESLIPTERVDRPDTLPVFAEDQAVTWKKTRRFPGDRKYIPAVSTHGCHCCNVYRKRELFVLIAGVLLMCLALTLIATGAIRVHVCNDVQNTQRLSDDGQSGQAETPGKLDKLFSINNFALEKPCTQSSTDESALTGRAALAVDGQIDTCATTDLEISPYWQVDLGTLRPIGDVMLHGTELNAFGNFQILVALDEAFESSSVCYNQTRPTTSVNFKVECKNNVNGRFIRLSLLQTRNLKAQKLVLCEVIVLER